jgi:hypothetical protein
MEQFLLKGTEGYWNIISVGIAQKQDSSIIYQEMNESNNRRQDELGDFLNRPIFIMKAKKGEAE